MSTLLMGIVYCVYVLIIYMVYDMYYKKTKKDYQNWKKDLEEIKNDSVRLVRHIDLTEQYGILLELHEIQEDYPNVSRHDTAMMNTINYYMENTARQLRYLDNKNEPSENGDNGTDNSN